MSPRWSPHADHPSPALPPRAILPRHRPPPTSHLTPRAPRAHAPATAFASRPARATPSTLPLHARPPSAPPGEGSCARRDPPPPRGPVLSKAPKFGRAARPGPPPPTNPPSGPRQSAGSRRKPLSTRIPRSDAPSLPWPHNILRLPLLSPSSPRAPDSWPQPPAPPPWPGFSSVCHPLSSSPPPPRPPPAATARRWSARSYSFPLFRLRPHKMQTYHRPTHNRAKT
jgi:protein transport protein SEC31